MKWNLEICSLYAVDVCLSCCHCAAQVVVVPLTPCVFRRNLKEVCSFQKTTARLRNICFRHFGHIFENAFLISGRLRSLLYDAQERSPQSFLVRARSLGPSSSCRRLFSSIA